MSLTLDRQNAYRARYANQTPNWMPATHRYEQAIRQTVEGSVSILVDMGCGRGGALEQLTDLPLLAVGLDPDLASLREHRLANLPRSVADANAIPLPANSCDLLISAWVLEHLSAPHAAFSEVARVLKPNGAFIFMTPNRNSPIAWLNRLLHPFQSRLVPLLYGRAEADTFPVVYQANSRAQLEGLTGQTGLILETLHIIHDPTYLAFTEPLFRLNVLLTRLLPASMGVHLVGVCHKK